MVVEGATTTLAVDLLWPAVEDLAGGPFQPPGVLVLTLAWSTALWWRPV